MRKSAFPSIGGIVPLRIFALALAASLFLFMTGCFDSNDAPASDPPSPKSQSESLSTSPESQPPSSEGQPASSSEGLPADTSLGNDATLNYFYITFPDGTVVDLEDPDARMEISMYETYAGVVTAVPCDGKAQVSGTVGDVSLALGENSFTTVVTAENGSMVYYPFKILVVMRPQDAAAPLSSDATLQSLRVVLGGNPNELAVLTPTATQNVYEIYKSEFNDCDAFEVMAVQTHAGATVQYTNKTHTKTGGNWTLPLQSTVTVTAQDGTIQTYTLNFIENP